MEENDMNKRRRKGFNNLDEVRVLSISLHKAPVPDSQWPQPARLTTVVTLPFLLSSRMNHWAPSLA